MVGSGWIKIYEYSFNTSPGKADRFLSCAGVARIKWSRYVHQVSLALLESRNLILELLDKSHYLRWSCILLCSMHRLRASAANEFVKGHFTIKKTEQILPVIGIDQAHKQNKKSMKTDGGAIGILDNEQTLLD